MVGNMSPAISIILATYNGERYLSDQIESLLAQNYKDWQLIISDDGSSDKTIDVIRKYVRKYPVAIKVLKNEAGNVGPSQNFLRLLGCIDTNYAMFCDQDDVWFPEKIKITMDKMKEIEAKVSIVTPVLIHTDLGVADRNLNVIADSFWKYQNLHPEKGKTLNRLLVQNVLTGCTMMINKALRDKIKLFPEQTIMYDWWIALLAAAFGKIDYVPSATILYRQHDSNNIGAKGWSWSYIANMTRLNKREFENILRKTREQAKAFLDIFRDELTKTHIDLLEAYSSLDRQSFFGKRLNLIKYKFFKIGLIRNIGLFWFV
ncbi:MAG: hypothetical protein A2Y10_05870 [Planctomycetes bacterium GWF2_41_51]|nr:MAG: hypothetical protein A2Y10_05870 [Planctomycetes bacterium GWF2_41_51]